MDAYHAACARITLAYDGFLAEFRGDGILAYFGYPRAHEDDAERTVRAGLDIIAAVADSRRAPRSRSRFALASRPAWWWSATLVARVRCGSMPWSGTRRTLQPAFRPWPSPGRSSSPPPRAGCSAICSVCATSASTKSRALPSRSQRGRSRACGFESRFEAVHATGLTDLIGREDEIDFLLGRQRLAWKGEGQIVLISGEPGIGKSRLAAALAERIAGEPHTRLRYQCSFTNQQRASSVHRPIGASGRVQGRRYVRATPRQAGSAPRHGRIAA